jgi:hypothetical protein
MCRASRSLSLFLLLLSNFSSDQWSCIFFLIFPYQIDVFSYDIDYSYSLSLSMSLPEVSLPTPAPTRDIPKGPPKLLGKRKKFRNRNNTNGRY